MVDERAFDDEGYESYESYGAEAYEDPPSVTVYVGHDNFGLPANDARALALTILAAVEYVDPTK